MLACSVVWGESTIMKKFILLPVIAFCALSCGKNKKYCWRCSFAKTDTHPGLDTTVCDMTETQSKDFQQNTVKEMNAKYGTSTSVIGSACFKQNNR